MKRYTPVAKLFIAALVAIFFCALMALISIFYG